METRHILQFSTIEGVKRNPGVAEDGKFPRFNNTTKKFDYACVGDGGVDDINLSFFTTLINEIYEDIGTDKYLSFLSRIGDTARFTRNDGVSFDLELGALAWEDTVEATLTLPGDTKVLFDENDSIGGSSKFTYNYTLDRIQLEDVPLMFKIGAETLKEGVKYLGNNSWSFGSGSISTALGSYNIKSGHRAGQNLGAASSLNAIYGPYAGEAIGSTAVGNVLIGPYAGRFESASNKFYLDNQSYGDASEGTSNSFLYADLETERRLYIRDRLSVEKEGKFGTSGLLDAQGEYGMYQMSAATGGNPQWHDGTVWQDFANSTDTYLDDVTYSEGTLTFTLSDSTVIGPIDISSVNTNVFATSPSSPSTGKTTTSDYGYLQLSNSAFTSNEGFTYKVGLRWNNTLSELNVPGAIKLAEKSQYGASNGVFIQDGDHAYVRLGDTWIQIDNDPLADLTAINIGGAAYEWFKQKNEDNELEFRTVRSYPIGLNNPNDRITFGFSSDGDAIYIGTTAERNRLSTTIDDPATDVQIEKDNEGETLHIRALREGDNIVLTETANYIKIDAVSGGTTTLMDGANLGTYNLFSQRNGTNLEFFGVNTTDSRISLTQGVTDVEFALNLEILGDNETPSTSKTYSGSVFSDVTTGTGINPKIWFKPIISNSIIITENENELVLETDAGSASNIGAGTLEVYNTGSSLPFEFKTISNTGNHFSGEETEGLIEFNVDDIVLTNLGTGIYSIKQNSSNSFSLSQKAFTEGYAISLDNDTNLIEIGVSELIPQFAFTTTPVYTAGLLEFKANYSNDVVNTALAATTLFEINIGDGLIYTPATNTLSTNQSGVGAGTDYALREVTSDLISDPDNYVYTFEVNDGEGTTPVVENTYSINVPKYILQPATYTNYTSSTGTIGGVKVEQFIAGWALGDTTPLALDGTTGKLAANKLIVTYEQQNNLHDIDNAGLTLDIPPSTSLNINTLRTQARANIGAAYVNGDLAEDFNGKDLILDGVINAESGNEHIIGDIAITRTKIKADTTANLVLTGYDETTSPSVEVRQSTIVLKLGTVSSKVQIKDNDDNTLFVLDENGDLYVKGSIRAGGTMEVFDTKAANL